ncbi:MAG: 3-methyl-2-oxobutanoate hydroxymethyltransferase [Desulfobulbaceae bacterium]|jgi:3-methyl-2-oxobutanoate hydroxymethyltransferase|nr:3-methyl-2-oxobutanoate hydroxymethyltransferase [Desulfobulbaceae bacterium]
MQNMKLTPPDIVAMKGDEKITMLTAYDAAFGRMLESAGVDMLLVGDSLGMVVLGYDSTVPVTMAEMIHHASAVRRGAPNTLLIGDMPFLSYQVSNANAIANAGRFFKEAGCDAVKLEGGFEVCGVTRAIVDAGMPVVGHIGLTPQTAGKLGGLKVQGKDADSARRLLREAKGLEEAGAFCLVLECIPDGVAQYITDAISIPTIGIGGGVHCDGQVLVTHDLLGMFEKFIPSFVKQYASLAPDIKNAVADFNKDVKDGVFPDATYSFSLKLDPEEIFKE